MSVKQQQPLFETQPAAWELDDQEQQPLARVVFATGPEGPFDYLIPEKLHGQVEPGRRVRVPFGKSNRLVTGYCVAVAHRAVAGRRFKPLAGVVDERTLLGPAMLRLTAWMAEHYLCSLGQVLEAVVPAAVREQAGTREATLLSVPSEVAARLAQLKLPPLQHKALATLAAAAAPMTAQQAAAVLGCTVGPIQSLRQKGLLVAVTRRVDVGELAQRRVGRQSSLALNQEQQVALAAILEVLESREHGTLLVHGVTGSGKTEVYIQAIEEVLRYGRQAIVLVPEISLTPQTEGRFRSRFDSVAVLHSHLSPVERHRHWQRIASGEVQVVVGARSAIFAPTPNLGLIVLDEEHETSFKQDTAPRYHARDVALERARMEKIPLVLGSATPSLDSWARAMTPPLDDSLPRYRLVSLPRRVFDRPMPAVGTIDLRIEFQNRFHRGAIGRQLQKAMEQSLGDGGQVILLLNRRGYPRTFSVRPAAWSCAARTARSR